MAGFRLILSFLGRSSCVESLQRVRTAIGISRVLMAPVMTLVMHLGFGAVLGAVYGLLLHRGSLNAT
ncbi:MAG: hypothetical protein H0V78_05015 [Burkholderiales bacterium]|nr:hypothetical protein [Burkholderiales bacterium]